MLVQDVLPDGRVRVRSVPIAGGVATTLAVRGRPLRSMRTPYVMAMGLAGDGRRTAATFWTQVDEPRERSLGAELAVGDGLNPMQPIQRLGPKARFSPSSVALDGDRLTVVESGHPASRLAIRDGAAPPRYVTLPEGAEGITVTGRLVAFTTTPPGARNARVTVREVDTGRELYSAVVENGVRALALREDGLLLTAAGEAGREWMVVMSPSAPQPRTLAGGPTGFLLAHSIAGDSALVREEKPRTLVARTVQVPLAGGTARPLTRYSAQLGGSVAVGDHLVSAINGCVVAMPMAEAPVAVLPEGPCPRAEAYVHPYRRASLAPAAPVPVRIRCLSAPPPGCRGEVVLRSPDLHGLRRLGRAPLRLAAGERRTLRLRLNAVGRRIARRDKRRIGAIRYEAVAIVRDPAGRPSRSVGTVAVALR